MLSRAKKYHTHRVVSHNPVNQDIYIPIRHMAAL